MRPFFLLLAGACALYACSTSNGDSIPDPDYNAPDLDAGGNTVPPKQDGSTSPPPPPSDAGGDAATSDADAAGPDPVNDVRINEVYVDQNGGGVATTFLELRGAPGTLLDELKIRILDSTGAVQDELDVASAPGDKIRTNGTWSIGGGTAPGHIDKLLLPGVGGGLTGWGFDTPRGAVQLVRGAARTLIDVVGYDANADAGALPAPPSPPTQTVENKPAILTAVAGKSFGRRTGAADTNDNRADFCQMAPTAGALNAACD